VDTKQSPRRRYRLRNWCDYNAALVRRGSLTLWLDEAALAAWVARGRRGCRGRPPLYSDTAIRCCLTLQAVYHLPLRATEGLVTSVLQLVGLALPVPDFSTVARRQQRLAGALPVARRRAPLHLVVDATGLKLYGEGEWKVRQYGWSRRRRWLKVPLGVDAVTGELRTLGVSSNDVTDGELLPELLAQERAPLAQVTGDGAYSKWNCYDAVAARPERPRAVFPPVRTRPGYRARLRQHATAHAPPLPRDEAIRRIRQVGRARWKREVGYHRRSLAETAVARFKMLFGDRVRARRFVTQASEVFIKGAALNRMTALGMPLYRRCA
jgi:IS5 family transposase